MDILLFDRYGLGLDEYDPVVIEEALERAKNNSNWVKNLNAKNDKILSKAKEEQAKWKNDRDILLNEDLRIKESKRISSAIEKIVNYIDNHISDENSFVNAEAAFAETGLGANDIKYVYEKYRYAFSTVIDPGTLESRKKAARQIAKSFGEFTKLINSLNDNIKEKFYESGIDISTFYSALNLYSCKSTADIEVNSEKLSLLSYDIYNRKLLKDTEKNSFMNIFSKNSNDQCSLIKALYLQSVNDFKINKWILFKYISLTCMLMDSKLINDNDLDGIANEEKEEYASALKKVFGVKSEIEPPKSVNFFDAVGAIPSEVQLGNAELLKGNFDKASNLFSISVNKNPYCWQGYWGLFKSETKSKTDSEVCFPGFYEKIKSGIRSERRVELYFRAKENAIAQNATEIDFYSIEEHFKEADTEEKNYCDFCEFKKNIYGDINTEYINNDRFNDLYREFNEKADKYKSDSKFVKNSKYIFWALILSGFTFLVNSLVGFFQSGSEYENFISMEVTIFVIALSLVSVGKAFKAYIESRSFFNAIANYLITAFAISGLIMLLFGITAFTLYCLKTVGQIILMVLSVLTFFFAFKAKKKREKLVKELPAKRMEAYDILENGFLQCFNEDLSKYYDSFNLSSFRISPYSGPSFELEKYFGIWEITPEIFYDEFINKTN